MTTEDQTEVAAFLASPSSHHGEVVERIDTHTAVVFLAGTRAWKLKRAVLFDYLDASTVERRRTLCQAEVDLNRRTAPDVYRGITPITRQPDGGLALGGSGQPIDWVVEMNRFDQDTLFDRLAANGRLDLAWMSPLARAIAAFHQAAERREGHGGTSGMRWVIEGNAAGYAEFGKDVLDPSACRRVIGEQTVELERVGGLLGARRDAGCVRQCHGDLHLRNIVLLQGQPVLFDAIEFNDEISCIDVLYDLAFLLMDLWRRELPRHANAVWNGYLAETADLQGIALMPLFLSCRAGVRAKTSATAARLQRTAGRASELEQLAGEYLSMAGRLLHPPPAELIAVGGFSGSGKSTQAMALAPSVGAVPGAVVLRSDVIRKELCGVPPLERLGSEGYTSEMSDRVYATLAERADAIVRGGHSAIVDAVYSRPGDRRRIEQVSAEAEVPFTGIWLEAPASTLIERVQERREDPSDADADVVRHQRAHAADGMGWHRIDASSAIEAVAHSVTAYLERRRTPASPVA